MNEYEKITTSINGVPRAVLIPVDPGKFSKTPDGTRFDMIERKVRNPKVNSTAYSLALFLKGYLPNDSPMKNKSPYLIIKGLSILVGFHETVTWSKDDHYVVPRSLAFDEMSEEEFRVILEKIFDECERLTGKHDIRENLHQYLAGFM